MRPLALRLVFLLPALLSWQAAATSAPALPLHVLASRADRVVRARVVASEAQSEQGIPTTVTRLQVQETLKGRGPSVIEVVQLGGHTGPRTAYVVGDARLSVGEDVLLLLRCRRPEAPQRCTLVGHAQGKVLIDAARGEAVLLEQGRAVRHPLTEVLRILRQAGAAR